MVFPVSPHAVIASGVFLYRRDDDEATNQTFASAFEPRMDTELQPVVRGNHALGVSAKLDRVIINCVYHDDFTGSEHSNGLTAARMVDRDRYVWFAEEGKFPTPQLITPQLPWLRKQNVEVGKEYGTRMIS